MRVLDETTVLDRQQLKDVTLDDRDLMQEVLTALLDDTSRQLRLMDSAIREHDPKQMMRLAHSCKGACANVGANAVASALRRLEVQAASESFDECAATLTALTREMDRLRVEVELANGEV
ncbi:MAG: Hpt protein [Candidatus Solibacter sp.]|nr:Hpt protein [Candidatus Solibacter sp.]